MLGCNPFEARGMIYEDEINDNRAYLKKEFGIELPPSVHVVAVRSFAMSSRVSIARSTKGLQFTEVRITAHVPHYKQKSRARREVMARVR